MREQDCQKGTRVRITGIKHPKESFPFCKQYIGLEGEILKTERGRFWNEEKGRLTAAVLFQYEDRWKVFDFAPDELAVVRPLSRKAREAGSSRKPASLRRGREQER